MRSTKTSKEKKKMYTITYSIRGSTFLKTNISSVRRATTIFSLLNCNSTKIIRQSDKRVLGEEEIITIRAREEREGDF